MLQSEILRKKIESKSIVRVGGAFDSMSAKLVEMHGFDAVWAGSFAISATRAVPDASILTMTEFFDAASNMTEACQIPVIADCDTGYGGPNNVSHILTKDHGHGEFLFLTRVQRNVSGSIEKCLVKILIWCLQCPGL